MSAAYLQHIASRPDICGGKPCIRGTRMRVRDILEYMAGGDSIDDLVAEFWYVSREDVIACLAFAADNTDLPVPGAAG